MRYLKKYLGHFVMLLLGIAIATGVNVVLAHGGDQNFIHTCVKTSNGSIRLVGPNVSCNNGETSLDWSKEGLETFGGFTSKDFSFSNLAYSSFDRRFFDGINCHACELYSVSAKSASFKNADLSLSGWQSANVTGANFSNSNFTDASIAEGAIVEGTNFTNANFTNTLLGGTDFTNAIRTGIIWSNTTCPDRTNSDSHGNTCEGHLTP